MNKYIIPICDIQAGDVWNQVVSATSLSSCKDKLIADITNEYDLRITNDWKDFVEECDSNDILIGTITDIEEI